MEQQISSVQMNHHLAKNPNLENMGKKRKFPALSAEALDFRSWKHKCCDPSSAAECDSLLTEVGEQEDSRGQDRCGKAILEVRNLDVKADSGQDSNNFDVDSWSCAETKLGSDNSEIFCDEASTVWSASASGIGNVCCHLDREMVLSVPTHKDATLQSEERCLYQEDDVVNDAEETVKHAQLEYTPTKCNPEGIEQDDDELEHLIYSSGLNPNVFFLSSERWNTDQEAQDVQHEPTIDQEFEEYFSSLML